MVSLNGGGGAWTKQHRGIAADAVLATAAHKDARKFLGALGEPKSASFSIIAYQDKATLLGQEWCARRQHFYNLWTSRGQSTTFTSEDVKAYVASDKWMHYVHTLTPADPAYHRSLELSSREGFQLLCGYTQTIHPPNTYIPCSDMLRKSATLRHWQSALSWLNGG